MRIQSLCRTSRVVVWTLAVVISTATTGAQQPTASRAYSSGELRSILENQPDFTADGIASDLKRTREVTTGRVARRGNLYRVDPGEAIFPLDEESGFELVKPGSYGVVRFTPDLEKSTALIVQPKDRRYYEVSSDDDDFMEVFGLMVMHPHVMLLISAVADPKKSELQYLGEEKIDGHPCVKFGTSSASGSERTTYFAARDLKNLVIRIEWVTPGDGNFIELFPTEGATTLRNVKIGAAPELFTIPKGFVKADRARELTEKETRRQAALHAADAAPRFRGVTIDPPVVRPGKTARLTAVFGVLSMDMTLSYTWKPDAGRIAGTGSEVEFDATGLAEGEYGVSFEAKDNFGHPPFVGRVLVKVRSADHDLSAVQTPFPSARFEQVFCAVDDRAGGWFVGGARKGDSGAGAQSIVHLLPDGSLDATFVADTGMSRVSSLALGDRVLYAGGPAYKGSGVVAIDVTSGARLPWDPNIDGFVETIALSGRTLYVGGELHSVGGVSRPNLAAIDVATAKVLPWNPAPDVRVEKLVVADTRLFVLGGFGEIAGENRMAMAAFDVSTGKLLDFESPMYPEPSAISVRGNVVYYIGGTGVGALDITTGRPLQWNPTVGGYGLAIAATDDTVYIAGDFTTVNGVGRARIAAIDIKSGAATDWDPEADSHSWVVIPSGNRIFVGGNFETIGRQRRSKFALLDARTGDALPGPAK